MIYTSLNKNFIYKLKKKLDINISGRKELFE